MLLISTHPLNKKKTHELPRVQAETHVMDETEEPYVMIQKANVFDKSYQSRMYSDIGQLIRTVEKFEHNFPY